MHETLETIALVLAISLFPLLIVAGFPSLLGIRNGFERLHSRRLKQAALLEKTLRQSLGPTLQLDWMKCQDLPKQHVWDLVAPYGWRYSDEDCDERSWWLRFIYAPGTPYQGPADRLKAELAEIDDDTHRVDSLSYGALGFDGFTRVVNDAGWYGHYRRLGNNFLLYRDTESPELRRNPDVVARARRFQHEHGFDPLDPERINSLRSRYKHWQSKIGCLPMLLIFIGLAIGPLAIIFGLSGQLSDDAEVIVVTCVGVGFTALAVGSIAYLPWVKFRQRRELGDHLDIMKELRRINADTKDL